MAVAGGGVAAASGGGRRVDMAAGGAARGVVQRGVAAAGRTGETRPRPAAAPWPAKRGGGGRPLQAHAGAQAAAHPHQAAWQGRRRRSLGQQQRGRVAHGQGAPTLPREVAAAEPQAEGGGGRGGLQAKESSSAAAAARLQAPVVDVREPGGGEGVGRPRGGLPGEHGGDDRGERRAVAAGAGGAARVLHRAQRARPPPRHRRRVPARVGAPPLRAAAGEGTLLHARITIGLAT